MKFTKIIQGEYISDDGKYKIEKICEAKGWRVFTNGEWDIDFDTKKECIEWLKENK